jgi:hypothetical protein
MQQNTAFPVCAWVQVEMMIQQPGEAASPLEQGNAEEKAGAGGDATGFERASQEIERASQELRPSQDGGAAPAETARHRQQNGNSPRGELSSKVKQYLKMGVWRVD